MDFFRDIFSAENGSFASSNAELLCKNASYLQIFKHENSQKLISHIKNLNATLTGKEDTHTGLAHLLLLLPQCPNELLVSHGEKWVRLCLSVLKFQNIGLFSSVLAAIAYIFKQCYNNSELRKSISKLDPNFVLSLSCTKSQCFSEVCECLFHYIKLFPLQVLPHKVRIESIVLQLLKNPSPFTPKDVINGARVFAALPFPGNADALNSAKGTQLDQLISLCHCAIDEIYSNIQENEEYTFTRDHNLPVTILGAGNEANQPVLSLLSAVPVLFNCLVFIQEFLSHSSSQFILLKPKELVLVAFRILQVDPNMLRKSHGLESTTLAFVLSSLHVRALKYLKVLINSHVCHLFMNLVEEQLVGILKSSLHGLSSNQILSTKDTTIAKNRNHSVLSIKTLCYECLVDIVRISNGCHVTNLEELLPVLISDVSPGKDKLEMRTAVRGSRLSQLNVGKKSKKKGYTVKETQDTNSSCTPDHDPLLLAACVQAALTYIGSVFLYAHHSLDVKFVMVLYSKLMSLASISHTEGVLASVSVRLSLLKALAAYSLYPHPLYPPNYTVLLQVFRKGISHPDKQISSSCAVFLATLSFAVSNPSVLEVSDVVRLRCEKIKESELLEQEVINKINSNNLSSLTITDSIIAPSNTIFEKKNNNESVKNSEEQSSNFNSQEMRKNDSEDDEPDNDCDCDGEMVLTDGDDDDDTLFPLPSSTHNNNGESSHHLNGSNDVSSSAMESSGDSDASDSESLNNEQQVVTEEMDNSKLKNIGQVKRKNNLESSLSQSSNSIKKLKNQKDSAKLEEGNNKEELSVEDMLESFVDAGPDSD